MKPLLLVGGGGHCRSCVDVIESNGQFTIIGIVDRMSGLPSHILKYPILGKDEDLPKLLGECPNALVTVGQIKDAAPRIRLFKLLQELGFNLPTIVASTAYVSSHANLLEGSIVLHGAILNANASIGRNCIINSQALVEHDAVVGANCHISTGAKINGESCIGEQTFIGSGAVIHESIRVGEKCIIGAGCIVREDLKSETVVKA